jgi:hypothetical protein
LDDAYVIVRRLAAPTHKLTAERGAVYLFDEAGFTQFTTFYSPTSAAFSSYPGDLSRQDDIDTFFNDKNKLYPLYSQLVKQSPLEADSSRGIRRVISHLREARGELDPSKNGHVYLFCEAVASFSVFMYDFLSRVVRLIGADAGQKEFEEVANYLLWGGSEQYHEKKLRQLVFPGLREKDLEFPAWNEFVKASSILIVGLNTVSRVPLAMRNLAMRYVGDPKEENELYTRSLLSDDPRLRQAIFVILRYLRLAGDLPKDFVTLIEAEINEVIAGKAPTSSLTV